MSDDVVGPYAELRAIQRRLTWLDSRLAELTKAVECALAAVGVAPLPAPAKPLPDVILSAKEVAGIEHNGTAYDLARLAASHERLRALADVAGRDGLALRAVLRELPDAVRALARRIHGEDLVVPRKTGGTMDWGVAAGYFVEQAIKRALAARGLTA